MSNGNPTPFYLRLVGWADLGLAVDEICHHGDNDDDSSPPTSHPRYRSCYRGYEHHITLRTSLHWINNVIWGYISVGVVKNITYIYFLVFWRTEWFSDWLAEATVFILLWSKVATRILCLCIFTQHEELVLHNWHSLISENQILTQQSKYILLIAFSIENAEKFLVLCFICSTSTAKFLWAAQTKKGTAYKLMKLQASSCIRM